MNKKYEEFVMSKVSPVGVETYAKLENFADRLHALLGLASEVGELLDTVKKHVFYGQPLDIENIEEELGDVAFYYTYVCNAFGLSRNGIIATNCDKLQRRYKAGFTTEESVERRDKKTKVTVIKRRCGLDGVDGTSVMVEHGEE